MKSLFKMTLVSLLIGLMLTSISFNASSQGKGKDKDKGKSNAEKSAGAERSKIDKMHTFNLNELEGKWDKYTKDPNFKILLAKVKSEGYIRLDKNEKTAWGYSGSLLRDSTKKSAGDEVEICVFDFYRKTKGGAQTLTMVWRQVGTDIYKCYMEFPENEKNGEAALEKAVEYSVDQNGKIALEHSFSRCWSRCVFTRFSATGCAAAMVACGGGAAALVAAGVGVTLPVAMGIMLGCAGVFCLSPLAICLAFCF